MLLCDSCGQASLICQPDPIEDSWLLPGMAVEGCLCKVALCPDCLAKMDLVRMGENEQGVMSYARQVELGEQELADVPF